MKMKLIALGTLIVTMFGMLSSNSSLFAQDYAHNYSSGYESNQCPIPCEDPCPPSCEIAQADPGAPAYGIETGLSSIAIGLGVAAVAAIAAIIIASGNGQTGHGH